MTKIRAGIRKATIALKIFPVICGSAFKNKGVQTMLDAVVDYLPSPLDIPPVQGLDVDNPEQDLIRKPSDSEPFAALVFKIMTDPYVGPVGVLPGVLGQDERRRVGVQRRQGPQGARRPPDAHARQQARRDHRKFWRAISARRSGLRTISTGDTICDEDHPIVLEKIDFPTPVIQLAVEPKTKADQEKMGMAIAEAGAGRSHFPGQYRSRNRADHSFGNGRTAPGNHRGPHDARIRRGGQCRQAAGGVSRDHPPDGGSRRPHKKQTGGSGQYARTKMRVEPSPGKGFEFVNEINGGNDSQGIHPSRWKRASWKRSKAAFWPASRWSDVKVTLYDGSYHDVDSSEMAFKICRFDLRSRKRAARPSRCCWSRSWRWKWWFRKSTWATVIGDLNSRRGQLEGMEIRGTTQMIRASVPLSAKCSVTRPSCVRARRAAAVSPCTSREYEEVPESVAEEIVSRVQGKTNARLRRLIFIWQRKNLTAASRT